ncbi:MAG: hypothetical protein U0169_03160 [Polyangiaceae bacterium]
MTDLRPELQTSLEGLLRSHGSVDDVGLDAVADALLPFGATHEEIDAFVERLERAGKRVGAPKDTTLSASLMPVLRAARDLRARGTTPTVAAVAGATGMDPDRVKLALVYGRTLGR